MSTEAISTSNDAARVPHRAKRFDNLRFMVLTEARRRAAQIEQAERWLFLSLVFVVALVIRMAALLSLRQISQLPGRQAGADGIEFEQLARALAEGRGYVRPNGMPTAFRAPGYPMFMSVIYRLTHINVSAATLSFPFLGAAICVVTYLLAREVVSERTARLSALLGVVYFPAIYLSTVWYSEPLFMLSFGICLWLFLIYLRNGSYGALAAAGLLFSWSVLVRPFAILMLPALLLLDLMYSRRRMITVSVLFVCSLTPTLLWAARNYQLYHAFVLGTNGGSTFYGGNNDTVFRVPEHMGGWVSTVRLPGRDQIVATPNEYAHDQVEWQLGKQWVRTHLTAVPLLATMKLVRFVLPDFDSENKKFAILSVIATLPFLPLWILGIRAAVDRRNRNLPWLVVHFGVAMVVATGVIFWGSPRFRDAVAPLLFIYAGCGLERLIVSRFHTLGDADAHMIRDEGVSIPSDTAIAS
jgi:4-amino-4-deoxy-L-arabinose transferase-like glycosyltransferase